MTGLYWLDSAIWVALLGLGGWVFGLLTRRWHRPRRHEDRRGT